MRLLIVDDEAPARARLRHLLAAHPEAQIVGEARDGSEALCLVAKLVPDALLLDIQMPGVNGLDVAASLPDPAPAVIFVTAYDRYALPAFDAAALDYLLKPVAPERLARALARLSGRLKHRTAPVSPNPPSLPTAPTQLLIPDRDRTHVIPVAEILWLEAADNYVVVHTAQRAPLMRRTLGALLHDLGPGFVRSHRSAAVALAYVQAVQTRSHGELAVVLRGGQSAPCSRQHRAAVLAAVQSSPAPLAPDSAQPTPTR